MPPTEAAKAPIFRWVGFGLMAWGWVAGSGLYLVHFTFADVPRTIYAPGGGVISDGVDHGSPKVWIVVSVLIFVVGLVVVLVDKFAQYSKTTQRANRLHLAKPAGPESAHNTASAAQSLYARYRRQQRK